MTQIMIVRTFTGVMLLGGLLCFLIAAVKLP